MAMQNEKLYIDKVTVLVWIRLLRGKDANPLVDAAIETVIPYNFNKYNIGKIEKICFYNNAENINIIFTLQNHTVLGNVSMALLE